MAVRTAGNESNAPAAIISGVSIELRGALYSQYSTSLPAGAQKEIGAKEGELNHRYRLGAQFKDGLKMRKFDSIVQAWRPEAPRKETASSPAGHGAVMEVQRMRERVAALFQD